MSEFRVDLAAFQGPLDLLLHLVQQEEVDIYEVSLAHIADRFLDTCRRQVHTLDVDEAGEYLVLASQLLVLKSRALLPRESPVDLEEMDPRLDLVRQLLEYRGVKQAAEMLAERSLAEADRIPVCVAGPDPRPREEEPLEVDLYALVSTFQRLLRETGDDTAVAVPRERLPITHFVEVMFDRLAAAGGRLSFGELVAGHADRTYVIGAFLALLELIKLRKIEVTQDGMGEIHVGIREDALRAQDDVERDLATEVVARPEPEGGTRLRLVFMGSPEFAVQVLESLVGAVYHPLLVATPPPRPAGRGRRQAEVPVARAASLLGLPLLRTSDVNGRTSREAVEACTPDVIVTVGFGQKLGRALLDLPPRGCLNVHASLLPRYRGASPISAALRDGADVTGVTIFVMDEDWDHGPIVAAQEMALAGAETADEVAASLSRLGADLLVRILEDYVAGRIEPVPQRHEEATYAPRLTKDSGAVSWGRPAVEVKNHVRSVTSWPGAQTAWQPKVRHDPLPLVLVATEVVAQGADPGGDGGREAAAAPGTVVAAGPQGIDVACGQGVLRVLRLRPAGGRVLDAREFLNSRRVVPGDRFT